MRQKSGPGKEPADKVVKDIRRATRRQFSAEEKIRIVLEGLRGEESIAELCRREGIVQNLGTSKNIPLWCDDRRSSSQRGRSFNPWPSHRGCLKLPPASQVVA